MDGRFTGKSAVVTGGGRGIGRAIALGLAREGAAVAVLARTRTEIEAVAEELRGLGARAVAVEADVAEPDQVDRAIKAAIAALGGIHILVNNAGINRLGRIAEQPLDEWWRVIDVCLKGTLLCSRALVPQMVERGYGRIVNIASRAAKAGEAYSTAYCSAKHAVLGFTRALAIEVAERGVTVNAVCPGILKVSDRYLKTLSELTQVAPETLRQRRIELTAQKRELTQEEIVPAVLFLASEQAARTTGEALNVSGGALMH